jgi:integrase
MPKQYLTDALLKRLNCPSGTNQCVYWDNSQTSDGKIKSDAVPGLGVRVTAQGALAFIHDYRFNGRRKRRVIGTPANMNVASARLAAMRRITELCSFEDPDADTIKPSDKHTITVADALTDFFAEKQNDWSDAHFKTSATRLCRRCRPQPKDKRRSTHKYAYHDFESFCGELALTSITPRDVQRYLRQFESPSVYNDGLKSVATFFNWVIAMQVADMRNPTSPLKKQKIQRQRRDYTPAEIASLRAHIFNPQQLQVPAIRGEGEQRRLSALAAGRAMQSNDQMSEFCTFLGILFLTMARPKEVKNAKFEHFDFDKLIWHKHDTKGLKLSRSLYNYSFRSVPIHQRVVDLVSEQRQRHPGCSLLFPARANPQLPRDNFAKQLARFRKVNGVPAHFQIYDLKRIAISMMLVGQGVRREDVSHYVDHKGNLETTMIYDLGLVDPLRPVSDRLGEVLGV